MCGQPKQSGIDGEYRLHERPVAIWRQASEQKWATVIERIRRAGRSLLNGNVPHKTAADGNGLLGMAVSRKPLAGYDLAAGWTRH